VGGRAGERGERGAADGCRHECAVRRVRRPSVLTRPSEWRRTPFNLS
jgi:hypothetical protein